MDYLLATIALGFGNYILMTAKRPGDKDIKAVDVVLWFLGVFLIHFAGGLFYSHYCGAN